VMTLIIQKPNVAAAGDLAEYLIVRTMPLV